MKIILMKVLTMQNLSQKITSRKFILALASFLASFGAGICGYFVQNTEIVICGIFCTALSAGFYSLAEAKVDAASAASTVTTVQATTSSRDIVTSILNPTENKNKKEGTVDESETTFSK